MDTTSSRFRSNEAFPARFLVRRFLAHRCLSIALARDKCMSTPTSPADTLHDPTANQTAARRSVRRPRRIGSWVIVVSFLAIAGVLALAVRLVGHVDGNEFSPDSFRHRNFSLYEVPYLEIQITPIRRKVNSTNTATYLRQKGLITNVPQLSAGTPADQAWHLVRLTRGLRGSSHRDAKILSEQLSLKSEGDHYWKQWSIDHPKKAKVFWPIIQRLARRELYVLMPNLFEIAQRDASLGEMTKNIDQRLQGDYQGLIADAEADGRDDLVVIFKNEFETDFPGLPL